MTKEEERKALVKEIKRLERICSPIPIPDIITIENIRTMDGGYIFNADSALNKIQDLPEKDKEMCLRIISANEGKDLGCRFCVLKKKRKLKKWVLEFDSTEDSSLTEETMGMILGTQWC